MKKYSVGVVGAGYVGLVTGGCLAHIAHRSIFVDVDAERIADVAQGEIPIYEPGLDALIP